MPVFPVYAGPVSAESWPFGQKSRVVPELRGCGTNPQPRRQSRTSTWPHEHEVAPGFAPAAVTAPVSLPLPSARPQGLRAVSASAAEIQQMQEDDLSNYLIEHSNTAASRGMGGTLSYARFAAHNAVYRPQAEEQR